MRAALRPLARALGAALIAAPRLAADLAEAALTLAAALALGCAVTIWTLALAGGA